LIRGGFGCSTTAALAIGPADYNINYSSKERRQAGHVFARRERFKLQGMHLEHLHNLGTVSPGPGKYGQTARAEQQIKMEKTKKRLGLVWTP